ncbi:MAG: ABC transporter permease, partial [Thermoplasmatota archaeon]
MVTSLFKKSTGDLRTRKSRTIFTVLTIAIAVGALGMFAVIPLFDDAIFSEIERSNMWNARVSMPAVELNETDIDALGSIENVKDIEIKQLFYTKIYIGERRNDALFVGMRDLHNQTVDIIELEEGSYPSGPGIVADSGNERNGVFSANIGQEVRILDANGKVANLTITGKGRTLTYEQSSWGYAVFFTDIDTLKTLSGTDGYNAISVVLNDTSEEAAMETMGRVEGYLKNNTSFLAFSDIPEIRENGDWPGKEDFADTGLFFYFLTFMTLFCSLFLISNTMHTIITEQRMEIAQMKAVGATKFQIIRSYLTTSMLMGGIGSLIGSVLGIFIAFGMVWYLGLTFYNITPGFSVHIPTILISAAVGIIITMAATLPSLFQALRITVREGMESTGISARYGGSFIDKLVLRSSWLPRSGQMGLRNVTRKKGRSISTLLQVALAVGMFLGVLSIGHSLTAAVAQEYDYFGFDLMTLGQPEGGKPLTEDIGPIIEEIEGVAAVEPLIQTMAKIGDTDIGMLAYNWDTRAFKHWETTASGRWYSREEQE